MIFLALPRMREYLTIANLTNNTGLVYDGHPTYELGRIVEALKTYRHEIVSDPTANTDSPKPRLGSRFNEGPCYGISQEFQILRLIRPGNQDRPAFAHDSPSRRDLTLHPKWWPERYHRSRPCCEVRPRSIHCDSRGHRRGPRLLLKTERGLRLV